MQHLNFKNWRGGVLRIFKKVFKCSILKLNTKSKCGKKKTKKNPENLRKVSHLMHELKKIHKINA